MGTVIYLNEWKREKQSEKVNEAEQLRYALFMQQHSDDDTFANEDEFEFNDDKQDS